MQDVVIVAATRTAIGSFQGALANVLAVDLGAAVIQRLLEQTGVPGEQVDEVILGHVLTAGAGQNTARQAAVKAGLPHGVSSMTLNKVCGSGLKAVQLAAQAIRCGDAEVVIAGGMENMSLAPYVMPGARTGLRMGHGKIVDTMIQDGLWDAFTAATTTWVSPPRIWWRNTACPARSRTPSPPPRSRRPQRPSKPGVSPTRSLRS